jgi:hypothetical protein
MLLCVTKLLENFGKNIPDGIWIDGPVSEDVLPAGRHVDFYTHSSGAILTAVVLLLHHHIEFVDPVLPGSVFQSVVFQGLTKPDQGNSTLVLYLVAHQFFISA